MNKLKGDGLNVTGVKDDYEGEPSVMEIKHHRKMKRSWENYKKMFKGTDYEGVIKLLDLRKASKKYTPLHLVAQCCDTHLKVMRKKDFPLESKKCKCGKVYLIEWKYS